MKLCPSARPTSGPHCDERKPQRAGDAEQPEGNHDEGLVHQLRRDQLAEAKEPVHQPGGRDVDRDEERIHNEPGGESTHAAEDTPMKPEQVTRLSEIETELVDIFVEECKPAKWPGMKDAAERGDRYWHKKNALATLTLVGRIQTVLRDARGDGSGSADQGGQQPQRPDGERDGEESIEQEARRLEKQGVAVLRKHEKRRG